MSVKLTKSPAEQQSHTHGIQLNANKPLKHNCRVKDRETLGHYKVVNIKVLMLHVTSFQFLQIFQFSRKKTKIKLRCTTPIYVLFICKRKIKSVEGLRRYRPYKLMNIANQYKKFYIFSKNSHFFNFREKSKLTLRCTAPIYVLSICKRKIKSVEGLRRYRPYKLMNILSPFKKFYIFSKNSHFVNF